MKKTSQSLLALPGPIRARDCPGLGLSLGFPTLASDQVAVSQPLCQDTRFSTPLCSSAVFLAVERRERKQNESTRGASVAAASLSAAVGGQGLGSRREDGGPSCAETGWGQSPEGAQELPGSAQCPVALFLPWEKRPPIVNIPVPQGKFGQGLELKVKTDWDQAGGTQRQRSVSWGRALDPPRRIPKRVRASGSTTRAH